MFGGDKNFRNMYGIATKKKYDFMTLNLSENPAEIMINFDKKIYPVESMDKEEEEEIDEDPHN